MSLTKTIPQDDSEQSGHDCAPSGNQKILSEQVLQALSQTVILVDAQNRIVSAFADSEVFLGRSKENLLELPLADLKGIGKVVSEITSRARDEKIPVNSYNLPLKPAINDFEIMDIHAQPFGKDGQVLLSLQPRRLYSFLDRHDDMEAAAKSVGGLASMLAHEIKNPLSGIRGAAQLISRDTNEHHIKLTELICKEVDRIKDLVDDLEGFSIPISTDFQPVNIHEVLDHVVDVAVAGFAAKANIKPLYDPSLPPVRGHFDRLVQVFLNLVKNAIEAAGPSAELTITTAFKHGISIKDELGNRIHLPIEIMITDNGPGIPEALKSYLFDPFVSGREGGTGLGLALVARYISEMGGTVSAENQTQTALYPAEGKTRHSSGASFKVKLSVYDDNSLTDATAQIESQVS